MSQHIIPNNDAWIARFKTLRDWVEENGTLPEADPAGGFEDTLRTWLDRQRAAVLDGTLDMNLEAILRSVPLAVSGRAGRGRHPTPSQKITELADFYDSHGRLPTYSGTAPGEHSLYRYLNEKVRMRYRRNLHSAADLECLQKIPGVFQPRVLTKANSSPEVLARDPRTAELVAFCETNGRAPGSRGPGPEIRLNTFMRRTIRPAAREGRLDEVTLRRLAKTRGVIDSPASMATRTSAAA